MIFHGSFIVGLLVLQGFAVRVEHFEERHIPHGSFNLLYFRLHDFDSSYRGPYIRVLFLDPEHEPFPYIFRSYVVARRVVLDGHILQYQRQTPFIPLLVGRVVDLPNWFGYDLVFRRSYPAFSKSLPRIDDLTRLRFLQVIDEERLLRPKDELLQGPLVALLSR